MYVRDYDFAGNTIWTSEFNNATGQVLGLYASGSGVYIAGDAPTGSYLVKYSPGGSFAWNRQIGTGAYGVSGDATGVYVSGYGYLQKYDANGNLDWTAQFG
jgi:hypothetical protein